MNTQKKNQSSIPATQQSKRRLEFLGIKPVLVEYNLNGRKLNKWVSPKEAEEIKEQKKRNIEKLKLKIEKLKKDKKK